MKPTLSDYTNPARWDKEAKNKVAPHGSLFDPIPSFESKAKHNTYELNYKGKNIARVYHKIKTDKPSGVYIEPNYVNKREGKQFLWKMLMSSRGLYRDTTVSRKDVKYPTGLDKGIDTFHKMRKYAGTFYHGSPAKNITQLSKGSYITPDPNLAKIFGAYHTDTGKTWTDEDLEVPYSFRGVPQWKKDREPKGNAILYKLKVPDNDIDKLGNPYEHILKRTVNVKQAIDLSLKPHQQRVVDRISDPRQPGLVVAHGLGSGKTLSSIGAYKALNMPTNVIVPASLQGNYEKELNKWLGKVPRNVNITSQQRVARQGLDEAPVGLDIIDESHRARELSSSLLRSLKGHEAKKRLLLTATPTYNHPRDIAPLVNLAAQKRMLPENKQDFEKRYIDYENVNPSIFQRLAGVKPGLRPKLKNERELKKILAKYVDYHPNSSEGFPRSNEETIKIPMGDSQTEIYKSIMGKAPWWVRQKVKFGLPPGRGELDAMRAFLSGARQVSNTNSSFVKDPSKMEAEKIQNAFKFLKGQIAKNPNFKAVVYSNYLNSGLAPYKQLLEKNQIPYGEFSGDIKSSVRNELVKQYNANKLKALLISSAGAEGLDLKGTRLVQILEPHFNEEKEKQIIGRAIRYMSHAGLPPEEQHVLIQRYLAQPKSGLLDKLLGRSSVKGADEYIRNLAIQKSYLNDQITNLLAQNTKV